MIQLISLLSESGAASSSYGYHYQYPSVPINSYDPWSYASATNHQPSYHQTLLLSNPYLYGASLPVPPAPAAPLQPQIQYGLLQPQFPQIQPLSHPAPKGHKSKPSQPVPPAPGLQKHKTNKHEGQVQQEQIQEQQPQQQQQEIDEQVLQQQENDVQPQPQQQQVDDTPVKGRPATKNKSEPTKGGGEGGRVKEQPAVKGSTTQAPEGVKKRPAEEKKEQPAGPSQDGDNSAGKDDANRSVVKEEKKEGSEDGFTRRKRADKLI